MFYKAIAQSVLLYGCETWNLTSAMLRALTSFHHRVARRISGRMPYLRRGEWVYPSIEEAREAAGLFKIDHYIAVRQRTFVDKIATRPILRLCKEAGRLSGSTTRQYWWTQPKLTVEEGQ